MIAYAVPYCKDSQDQLHFFVARKNIEGAFFKGKFIETPQPYGERQNPNKYVFPGGSVNPDKPQEKIKHDFLDIDTILGDRDGKQAIKGAIIEFREEVGVMLTSYSETAQIEVRRLDGHPDAYVVLFPIQETQLTAFKDDCIENIRQKEERKIHGYSTDEETETKIVDDELSEFRRITYGTEESGKIISEMGSDYNRGWFFDGVENLVRGRGKQFEFKKRKTESRRYNRGRGSRSGQKNKGTRQTFDQVLGTNRRGRGAITKRGNKFK